MNRTCPICDKECKTRRKICNSCYTRIRRYRTKEAAIKLLGGVCARCGWSGPQSGFDFHHINDDKEFQIGNVANRSWSVVKKELLKCELLCACCHRIEHSNRDDSRLLEAVNNFNGKELV